MKEIKSKIRQLFNTTKKLDKELTELMGLLAEAEKAAQKLQKEKEKLDKMCVEQRNYILYRDKKEGKIKDPVTKPPRKPYSKPLSRTRQLQKLLATLQDATVVQEDVEQGQT